MNDVGDRIHAIEQEAAQRFVRWDPGVWRSVLAGPARVLSDLLVERAAAVEPAVQAVESYLRLVAHGIGLGYLVPAAELGATNFFTLAFTELVPLLLPALPPEQWAGALAQCWNLGENLETAPQWLRRLFLRAATGLQSLTDLESLVARVSRAAFDAPARRFDADHGGARVQWVHLGAEDWRFLPGAVHFVAPTVLCVHDRHRAGEDGRSAVTLGVHLSGESPEILGPMGCDATPARPGDASDLVLAQAQRSDPSITGVYGAARNEWRLAATLVTSQSVVALLPEGDP